MSNGTIQQVLLITDGCSNTGGDPVAIAAMAPEFGITINVVGIADGDHLGEKGMREVTDIAQAGGGIHQVVSSDQLPKTVQMVTRKAMTGTIQQVVNQELKQLFGKDEEVGALNPEKRSKVVEVVEQLGETMDVDVLILVDTSASMTPKLPAVKQALYDLRISMQSRTGANQFSVWTYPGSQEDVQQRMDWSADFSAMDKLFASLQTQGTTPTGPALEAALAAFNERKRNRPTKMIEAPEDEDVDIRESAL